MPKQLHARDSANLKDAYAVQRVELVDESSAHQGNLRHSYKHMQQQQKQQQQQEQQQQEQQQQQQQLLRSVPYQAAKDCEGDVVGDAVGQPAASTGKQFHLNRIIVREGKLPCMMRSA